MPVGIPEAINIVFPPGILNGISDRIFPQGIQYPRYDYSGWKWHTISAGIIGIAAAIPLLILIARIIETSLETIRTIYIARGHANLAACIGITKTGIWLLSTGLVLTNLSDYGNLFAYLAGYGIGTLLGM